MQVNYYLNGVDLRTYGVSISESEGLISRPKAKAPLRQSWQNYHGEVIDLSTKYYEPRKITFHCFMKGSSNTDFITKMNTFLAVLDTPGSKRLMVNVDSSAPLLYEVYLEDQINPKKKWSAGSVVATFTLTFIEHSPVKKALKHIRTSEATKTATITLTSDKLVDIYWGDGTVTYDVYGTNQTVTHDYAANGTFYILVTGCIDEITSLTSNATVVWNKL